MLVETCTPSQTNTVEKELQSHHRMGQMPIPIDWHHLRLGFQTKTSQSIHARYINKALRQFKLKARKKPNQPYQSVIKLYGTKKQYATPTINFSSFLDKKGKKFIQQVCGKFLFFGTIRSQLHITVSHHQRTV